MNETVEQPCIIVYDGSNNATHMFEDPLLHILV